MTPHNSAKKEDIAKTVLLFGDGVQAHHHAHQYLSNVRKVSDVRYACFFTGEYKGKTYTFGTCGMGMGSTSIYVHELYAVYDVQTIIRVGSCASYVKDLNVMDTCLAKEAYSEHTYIPLNVCGRTDLQSVWPTEKTYNKLVESAKKLGYNVPELRIHGSNIFYYADWTAWKEVAERTKCEIVDMETYALFLHAMHLKREAASILTINTVIEPFKQATWEQRTDMRMPALEIVLNAGLAD